MNRFTGARPNPTFRDGHHRSMTAPLTLKHVRASRSFGQWRDEEYDVAGDSQRDERPRCECGKRGRLIGRPHRYVIELPGGMAAQPLGFS